MNDRPRSGGDKKRYGSSSRGDSRGSGRRFGGDQRGSSSSDGRRHDSRRTGGGSRDRGDDKRQSRDDRQRHGGRRQGDDRPRRDDRQRNNGRRDGAGRQDRRPSRRDNNTTDRTEHTWRPKRRAASDSREVALSALDKVTIDDAYANIVLPRILDEANLEPRDAALATELTYGTLRAMGLYDLILADVSNRPLDDIEPTALNILRLGTHQILAMRVPEHAAVDQSVSLARDFVGTGSSGFVNAILRKITEKTLDEWSSSLAPDDPVAALAATQAHPEWVVRALRDALVGSGRRAEEITELLIANNTPARVSLAVLPVTDDSDGSEEADKDEIPNTEPGHISPYARTLKDGAPHQIPQVRRGAVRVQDEGSQLAAMALLAPTLLSTNDEVSDDTWLDLCSGPGGKAALLAAIAHKTQATLTCVEPASHRAELVTKALNSLPGSHQIQVRDGREVGEDLPDHFDRILVDVPCTGLGALRRRPEARWRRTPDDLVSLGPLQRALLNSALDAVRPGGVVAYVTCSPHPAETYLVVHDAVRDRSDAIILNTAELVAQMLDKTVDDLGVVPIDVRRRKGDDAPESEGEPTAVQLWTHLHGTDSMFICLLRKTLGE